MTPKHINKINKMIDEFGEPETAKMLGISLPDLFVITKINIDAYMAGELIYHLFVLNKIPNKYNGFKLEEDEFTGTIIWSRNTLIEINGKSCIEETLFYATPFWEQNEGTPIDSAYYSVYDNKYQGQRSIMDYYFNDEIIISEFLPSDSEFSNIEELVVWYKDFYLPKTYEVIIKMVGQLRTITKTDIKKAIDKESKKS